VKLLTIFNCDHRDRLTGAHHRYFHLLEFLSQRHQVVLVSPSNPYPECPNITHYSVKAPQVNSNLIPNSVLFWANLCINLRPYLRDINQNKPQIIYTFDEMNAVPAIYLRKKLNRPVLLASRSDKIGYRRLALKEQGFRILPRCSVRTKRVNTWYLRLFARMVCRVYKKVDRLIVQSEYHKKRILEDCSSIDSRKIHVIPNNISEEIRANWDSYHRPRIFKGAEKEGKLVYVGSLVPRKGVQYLIEALAKLRDDGRKLILTVVGYGEDQQRLEKLSRQKGVHEQVHFVGYVSDPLPYIAQADLLVLPSLDDAFPNVVLEAMAVGTPVIATEVGAVPEMLEFKECLVPPGNANALAERISQALNSSLYKKLERQIEKRAQYYSFNWCQRFEDVLYNMVDSSHED